MAGYLPSAEKPTSPAYLNIYHQKIKMGDSQCGEPTAEMLG